MALEILTEDERRARIAALYDQAWDAHFQFETVILRGPDGNRPRWLAGFMLDPQRHLEHWLPATLTEERLASLLREYDAQYEAQGGEQPRHEYVAQRLLADVT